MGGDRIGWCPLTPSRQCSGFSFQADYLSAELLDEGHQWRLSIERIPFKQLIGDKRVASAVVRLLNADYLLGRAVTLRGYATMTIPKERRLHFRGQALSDLVRPLCMQIRIVDTLYKYQRYGASWLLRHPKAILADDMGLGKTAQAIRAAQRLIRNGRVTWMVVVAPGTLLSNWIAEFEHWAPELVTEILTPGVTDRDSLWRRARNRCHVSVCSYEQLRIAGDAIRLAKPDLVVADEAHRLRTDASIISSQFRDLPCDRKWLLTGTPIENQTEDLAVLMSILEPSRFSAADAELHDSSLRARVRPYILRRRKEDVLSELPPVIEQDEILRLTANQKIAYNNEIAQARRSGSADFLALFNRLRSTCDVDPKTGSSSKIDRTLEIIADAEAGGHKVVVFSYLLEPLHLLSERLRPTGIRYALLIGSMSLPDRDKAVSYFKNDPMCTVLIASMRVASEGLTLTEASIVVFVNRWWNPSANVQARDRVVRIGQKKPVTVITFTCKETVEERLPKILASKKLTFESVVENLATSSEDLFEPA